MAAVLEVCMSAKELNAKDIYKETFQVYDGKCLSRKTVHNWLAKHFADGGEDETEMRKCLR
jgi:hypothetical protein